jgi:hypothetical protein
VNVLNSAANKSASWLRNTWLPTLFGAQPRCQAYVTKLMKKIGKPPAESSLNWDDAVLDYPMSAPGGPNHTILIVCNKATGACMGLDEGSFGGVFDPMTVTTEAYLGRPIPTSTLTDMRRCAKLTRY